MDNTDYCSYELARKLKECGFREKCQGYYQLDFPHICYGISQDHNNVELTLSAPTLWEAQKWLREKGYFVSVYPSPYSEDVDGECAYKIYRFMDCEEWDDPCAEYEKDYNSALSAGISAALELIGKV